NVERLTGSTAPDLATRPDALATLLAGQARASELARMGRLMIPDADRAAALDGLFSTRRRPHCPNMF
ncbi:MAG: sterol carrier protein domain-containing protein, partial [Pseudomonadota bacterium]